MTDKSKKTAKNEDIETLIEQIEALTQALQRERADAVNLRRRHEEETTSLRALAKANVIHDLLPVIDNFERALKHVPKDLEDNDYIKGVRGVVKQFDKTLSDMGVERIKTVGQPFDPHLHEAVSLEDGDGKREIISEEIQAGYKLDDNVLRHALVKVRS